MKNFSTAAVRALVVLLVVTALLVTATILPGMFSSKAENHAEPVPAQESGLPNFDIRLAKTSDAVSTLDGLRATAGRDAVAVDLVRSKIAEGADALRTHMPDVVVEYNDALGSAEVISPNVWKNDSQLLSPTSEGDRPTKLRDFIKANSLLVGLDEEQINSLKVAVDYTNPDGNLSYTHLEQEINGVPVFAGEVKAGVDKQGRIIRVINNLAPGVDQVTVSSDFGEPADAVRAAAGHINHELRAEDTTLDKIASTDRKLVFGANTKSAIRGQSNDWATTAERMYFPTEPGVVIPAWRVLIWQPENAYYVIVDRSGTMLWRKNIREDQTQPATYNVYRNPNAYIDVADSPAPFTPGPNSPNGQQAPVILRSDITLIGNEGSLSFNNNGWVTDGTNITDGNSNQAGIDRDFIDGVDAPQTGNPNRVFSSPTWNPPPGNPGPGDGPLTAQAQRGAVIQMFYVMNRYHDELYKRGFTEAARNFQHNNFSRGGLGNDRVSSQGQDNSGTNNANFFTPADGSRGLMQMYIWTGPTPDYDGTADADIIIHEVTHGLSNRLVGNASGLSTNMARGLGEGWGDWYGHTMLAEADDSINGIYTTGGYATYLGTTGYVNNYYYGIRRFPKAVIAFKGTNGLPHNPLTFRFLNSNCGTFINTTGAFGRGPFGASTCDAVHNAGEIWSSALWEVRARMIQRLDFRPGTERVLQIVTDGMKLTPLNPTFLQARDAIISAAQASSPEDAADVREGFRLRGMGFNASIQSTSPAAVTENFDPWPGDPTPTPTPTPTATPTPTPTATPTPTPTPVPTATVSGIVTRNGSNKGLGGVTITITGPGFTSSTSTAGNGSYSLSGVPTGATYTITPSANRYTFTPTSRTILVNGNVSGQNFVGTR